MNKRVITTELMEEDIGIENHLRPKLLEDYIGQTGIKDKLKVYIQAAKQREEPLDHVLFYGPPGLGKTTLAMIIANEMNVHLKITSGPAIEKPGEIAAFLNSLSEGDVLFIDEIHRMNRQVEEVLYPAMEDFAIDIMIGKGATARSVRLDLPRFTLVGATTRAGMLQHRCVIDSVLSAGWNFISRRNCARLYGGRPRCWELRSMRRAPWNWQDVPEERRGWRTGF